MQRAEWAGCDLQDFTIRVPALSPFQGEILPVAVLWDTIGIFPSFQVMNLMHLERNGHTNILGELRPDGNMCKPTLANWKFDFN